MERYRVTLTTAERAQLEHTVSVGKAAARQLTHARILLLADASQNLVQGDEDIVAALGTSLRTVERVRKRLVTEGFQAALNHRPQPPRPDKIKKGRRRTKADAPGLQRSSRGPLPLDLESALR